MVTVILTYCIGEENIFFIKIFSGDTEQQLQKLAHEALQRGDTRDLVARLAEVTLVMILMILVVSDDRDDYGDNGSDAAGGQEEGRGGAAGGLAGAPRPHHHLLVSRAADEARVREE